MVDLDKIKDAVDRISAAVECTARKCCEINLVLEELFTNIVSYGFPDNDEHDIDLLLTCDDEYLMIRLEDDGQPFNILKADDPDTKCALERRGIGGLGIHFVKHFIDDCKYHRKKGKNILILKQQITDAETEEHKCISDSA